MGMATHSSILAWRIPWTEEPGGLQFIGSQRVGYEKWLNTHIHIYLSTYLSICIWNWLTTVRSDHSEIGKASPQARNSGKSWCYSPESKFHRAASWKFRLEAKIEADPVLRQDCFFFRQPLSFLLRLSTDAMRPRHTVEGCVLLWEVYQSRCDSHQYTPSQKHLE